MSILRRKRKYLIVRTPRFLAFFRRNTEASTTRGNRVTLFSQGGEFLPAMLHALMAAERLIVLEFYIIKDDCTGCAFADALLSAAGRGVRVFLLYDYVGCFDTPATYFKRLEKGGVKCLPFNPPPFRKGIAWFDKRDHRKMAVIDGRAAFVGGLNIADEYAGYGESVERWRDMGVRIAGPAAAGFQQLFLDSWLDEGGMDDGAVRREAAVPPEDADGAEVMIVSGGPHHNRSFIRGAFRMAIAGASEDIKILNPYFLPGPRVLRSLLRAAGRGVRVQLVLPAKSDMPLVRLISRSHYALLLRGGIEIFERQGTVLHAKVMLIDDYWAVIGSANLDQRSFHRNYEVNVIVDSREFGDQVAGMFAEDLDRSRRIVLEEHERRGFWVRLLERCCAPISWFL
ncbi:MAG TPA: phospholipase D-like domain-containing protein [Geobacteraceae bacterium]